MSFDFEHAHKRREQIKQNIEKSYNSNLSNLSDEDLEKSANNFFEKGGKRAVIGERRTFGGREYIKTAQGWKFHGKGTGTKAQQHHDDTVEHHKKAGTIHPHEGEEKVRSTKSKNATDHFVEEGGKHYIDVLDPDTGEKKFKVGDKVHYHDDNGKKHIGVISDREHEDGDMFEVDRDRKSSARFKKQTEEDLENKLKESEKEISDLKKKGVKGSDIDKEIGKKNDTIKTVSSALVHRFMDLEGDEAHDNAEKAIKDYLVAKGIDRKHLENEPIMEDMTFYNEDGDMTLKQAQKHVKDKVLPYLDELVQAMKEDGLGAK